MGLEEQRGALERAAALLRKARYGVALTGAGISTPSGIPDFRSDEGLWRQVDPMEVASLWGFRLNPERFYNWIRPLIRTLVEAQPNPAHYALAEMEREGWIKVVITQNIDRLHQKAGSTHVLEVHGSIETMTCQGCGHRESSEPYLRPEVLEQMDLPRCPHCGGVLKPDVVLFGEALPWATWRAAEEAVQQADVLLVAGSSLEVYPVADLPYQAARRGTKVILVNLAPTAFDPYAEVLLRGDVAEVLPALVDVARAFPEAPDSV